MIELNDSVVVVSDCGSQGKYGTVISFYRAGSQLYAVVKLDDERLRQYNVTSLRRKTAMNVNWTMVGIRLRDSNYGNGKRYFFKSYEKEPLTKGEFCIVNTSSGYQVGVVETEFSEPTWEPTQDVVCRIDDAEYLRRRDSGKRAAELKEKMTARLKQVQETILFELLAPSDERLAELLAEYKEVTKND